MPQFYSRPYFLIRSQDTRKTLILVSGDESTLFPKWPSLWKSREYVATPYLFMLYYKCLPAKQGATHVQLSRAFSNHVIECRPSSGYCYSQSFSTVKREQIKVPCVELWESLHSPTLKYGSYRSCDLIP